MSGFRQPVSTAQIVAAGAMLTANNLDDVANKATSRTNLAVLGVAANLSDVNNATTALVNLGGVPKVVVINAQTDSYTLALTDLGKLVTITKATGATLTIDTNANVAFAVGAEILIAARGAGQVTVTGAGGVTVTGNPGLKLSGQYSYGCLTQIAADVWDLVGQLAA